MTLFFCACVDRNIDGGDMDATLGADVSTLDTSPGDANVMTTDSGSDGGLDSIQQDADHSDVADDPRCEGPTRLRVATFNTGTTSTESSLVHPDGYRPWLAETSDEYYGNGLAWLPAVDATRRWLGVVRPDVIVFQELFHSPLCVGIPEEDRAGFVCERWMMGDLTVVNEILGPDYQVACNLGKPDKCAAVHRDVGTFRGCEGELCLDGLEGARVDDCGSGSRVGRGVIDLVCGGDVTVVNVHGSSGFGEDDQDCRSRQFGQVFRDLRDGSGEPAANGTRNIIMGDFNTDPGRATLLDDSADRLERYIDETPFRAVSPKGRDAPGSYGGVFDIDYILSDVFDGPCEFAGLQNSNLVYPHSYFDHYPLVCELVEEE